MKPIGHSGSPDSRTRFCLAYLPRRCSLCSPDHILCHGVCSRDTYILARIVSYRRRGICTREELTKKDNVASPFNGIADKKPNGGRGVVRRLGSLDNERPGEVPPTVCGAGMGEFSEAGTCVRMIPETNLQDNATGHRPMRIPGHVGRYSSQRHSEPHRPGIGQPEACQPAPSIRSRQVG